LLSKFFTARGIKAQEFVGLTKQESMWVKAIKPSSHAGNFIIKPPQSIEIRIRMDNQNFEVWLKAREGFVLFFDRASKGNHGVAGAGGFFFILRAKEKHIFPGAWGK
jgi:hypothetical protein